MNKWHLVILLFLVISFTSFAQSLQDVQNIKVNQLSDAQVQQLLNRAAAQGLTEQQLLSMAAEKGMPANEISLLGQRINALKSQSSVGSAPNMGARELVDLPSSTIPQEGLSSIQKRIFGFSLFHNKNLNFSPALNVPTPPSYILGAGDQILIDIYGASQQSFDLKVNPEGKVFIPNVGSVEVAGASVAAATARLKLALTKIYSGLAAGNTTMELRLGNIRTVSVSMVGELTVPGTYKLPSFASPFNALFAAGGPTQNGSFRNIQIYRNNKLHHVLDIYDFLLKGEFTSPMILQDNDVIIVPPVQSRVEINGAIRREGLFEMKPGESLAKLLEFTGGFNSNAYKERISVSRKTSERLKVEDVFSEAYSAFFPQDGDVFSIGQIQNRYENRVQITGALLRPGTFELTPNLGILKLIERAGGLREDAFLNRATLYRTRPDFTLEILGFDIGAVVRGEIEDIVLQREDVLDIPSIYDVQEEFYVKISGEVNAPGSFAFGENMKVGDLLLNAGGFKVSASPSHIEVVRRVKDNTSGAVAEIIKLSLDKNLKIIGQSADISLQPFDHVIVRKSPGFQAEKLVKVEGEVLFPGAYAILSTNERVSDLVMRSGGLTEFAYLKGATLIRRNEFYADPSETAVKKRELRGVINSTNADGIPNNEAENAMVNRIRNEISNTRNSEEKGTLTVNDYKKETIEGILEDETNQNVTVRTTEMIGINLTDILSNPGGINDLLLKEGDVLSIPTQLQTVRMRGEVLYPTTSLFKEYKTFGRYISNAGGYTDDARKSRAYVIYANGSVKKTTRFLLFNKYPEIEPGAEIIVPKKVVKERLSAQTWIGIATSMATLAIMIDRLTN